MTLKGHNALWCANRVVLWLHVSRSNHHDICRVQQSSKLIACLCVSCQTQVNMPLPCLGQAGTQSTYIGVMFPISCTDQLY